MKIAFLGLGHMGGPMSANLVAAGHTVHGFDPVATLKDAAAEKGAQLFDSVADATAGADVVITSLPNGDICLAMTWSGDYAVAAARAEEAGLKVELAYTVPKEGSNIWFDAMLIPKDAPHADNAHKFLNYMMRPEVIAACTNYTYYANGNLAAKQFVNKDILDDPAIYPDAETQKRMFPSVVRDESLQRVITREWTRIKTGQ